MRIAVYSGSFNPLHIGHQAIMEYLTLDAAFDWVYLIVSPQSPFKGAENALTGEGGTVPGGGGGREAASGDPGVGR